MNCEEIIKKNIKLFQNDKFFYPFSKILQETQVNLFKKKNHKLLTNDLDALETITEIETKKINNKSPWYLIMKLLLFSNEKNFYYNNLLSNKYLKKISEITIKQLLPISIKCKLDISECVNIYLKLSEEKLFGNKKNNIFKKYGTKKDMRNAIIKRLTAIVKIPLLRTLKKEDAKLLFGDKKLNNKANSQKHKIIDAKNNKSNQNTFLYCNSFTHLFIGDTDEESVKQRYLSNIIVKNEQRLNIHGSYVDLSAGYLKQLYKKIIKQNQAREINPVPEDNSNKKLLEIQKMFKKDYRKIENLKKKGEIENIIEHININNSHNSKYNNNLPERNNKRQPKFLYPSIINFNHDNNKHLNLNINSSSSMQNIRKTEITKNNKIEPKKENYKKIKSYILRKKLKNENIKTHKNNLHYLNSNNIDNKKKTNIISDIFKKDYNFSNTFTFNNKCLSSGNSVNNSIIKDKKSILIKKEANMFNKRLKNKNGSNINNINNSNLIMKKKLFFNSIISNSNNKNKNTFNKNSLKRKVSLKNFLEKTDFFFNDINF